MCRMLKTGLMVGHVTSHNVAKYSMAKQLYCTHHSMVETLLSSLSSSPEVDA